MSTYLSYFHRRSYRSMRVHHPFGKASTAGSVHDHRFVLCRNPIHALLNEFGCIPDFQLPSKQHVFPQHAVGRIGDEWNVVVCATDEDRCKMKSRFGSEGSDEIQTLRICDENGAVRVLDGIFQFLVMW